MKKRFMFVALAFAAAAGFAHAQTPNPPNTFLLGKLQGGATLERYLQAVRAEFSRLDADGDGKLDAADLESHAAIARATIRTSFAMQIMSADLDGDGAVTADEMRRKLHYDRRNQPTPNRPGAPSIEQQIEEQVQKWLQADTDKDGKVTWLEAIEAAKQQPNYSRSVEYSFGPIFSQLQELTPQGKSALTLADLEAAATAFFRGVDSDNNGTISTDEIDAVRQTARRQSMEQVRVKCEMPQPSEAARLVLLGAYETESLSTVALGSQDDVTGVGNVTVEPGNEPLYLVVVTYRPTIWRFDGSTERIERVVATGHHGSTRTPLAGVVGVPAEKISFPKQVNCIRYFYEIPSWASAQAAGAVKAATGKSPDVIAGKYKLNAFKVPSGTIEVIQGDRPNVLVIEKSGGTLTVRGEARNIRVANPTGDLQRELYRSDPGGVVTIDPTKVIASTSAEPYEVLPGLAGLIQLVQSGAVTQNRLGEFLINRKIRFPAHLHSAHSGKFLLRSGVPEPDGDPGHSNVFSEDTGAPLVRPKAR
jgi:Ca2+-binding EF-hand superfamily protein